MIRLLIADDHAIVREGLKQLFALFDDIFVAAEASNGRQVLDALREGEFDLLLLDMSMSNISGVELISRIRAHHPGQPILILSMHSEPGVAARALKAGASGYLSKDSDSATLMAAIRKVAAGGRFLDPALGVQMAFETANPEQTSAQVQLTDREYHIMGMLVRGMGVNEIAKELSLSNKTVSTHKMRLMKKMNLENTADLVRYAITHGLAE